MNIHDHSDKFHISLTNFIVKYHVFFYHSLDPCIQLITMVPLSGCGSTYQCLCNIIVTGLCECSTYMMVMSVMQPVVKYLTENLLIHD